MKLNEVFKKTKRYISLPEAATEEERPNAKKASKPIVPQGLLKKCNVCKAAIIAEDAKRDYYICPKCGSYFRMHAYRRMEMILDEGSLEEWDRELSSGNPLKYKDYEEKVNALREKTKLDEGIITGMGRIHGIPVVIGVCDGRFMMASMGKVVGEKIAKAVEKATRKRLPVILFACSGGARMQEGIVSLMQMAKTAAALKRHSDVGLLYISVLTDPTTGGVTASYAMLGDIILAEPGALIGFAGPRVIEQTIGEKLPEGFQRAEFLLEHGFVDQIIKRENMKEELAKILKYHEKGTLIQTLRKVPRDNRIGNPMASAWDRVQTSRMKDRPVGGDYIKALFTDFTEFHGDRYFKDDKAIIGGIGYFHGMPVTVIAQAKGKSTKENVERNFGMPSPEGYRKALRLMKQAEKFNRPILCFVDTPGAFCGLEAEERGQGEAIARNLFELSNLQTPILSIVIGEGGSGGALALAVADEVWMLENSIYSVLSPEGFASILWKDAKRAKEAAGIMKLTARDLKRLGIIEKILPEPEKLTSDTMDEVVNKLDYFIEEFLKEYSSLSQEELVNKRYKRFRLL
ncbi:MAG: acetyl-CoA carboxylase carboxyltransferase subunit beta [Lachnospiraceae bacterium]|jgi:acetyl-CoA carboxylase carboxyl transferase alpha subunit/acetyl-CoA carboxylase carboxyl transferase beta subunit|nr:acetyl-CoA carboxylase carboxyltransferase subunit beta [Lachnospiraceae bacterium]